MNFVRVISPEAPGEVSERNLLYKQAGEGDEDGEATDQEGGSYEASYSGGTAEEFRPKLSSHPIAERNGDGHPGSQRRAAEAVTTYSRPRRG